MKKKIVHKGEHIDENDVFNFSYAFFLGILNSHPSKPKNNFIENSINTSSFRIELNHPARNVYAQLLIYPQYIKSDSFSDGSPCLMFTFFGYLYIYNGTGDSFLPDEHSAYLFPGPNFSSIQFKTDGKRFKILTADAKDTIITKEGNLCYEESFFDTDIFYTLTYHREVTDTMLIIKNIECDLFTSFSDTAKVTSYPNREFILLKLEP